MTDNNEDNIPIEGPVSSVDVIDSEFQQVDLDVKEANSDSLFKDKPLMDDKRHISRRRRFYNILAVVIGLIALLVLVTTLIASKDKTTSDQTSKQNSSEGDKSNQHDSSKDLSKTDNEGNSGKTTDANAAEFTCTSTIVTCPEFINGTWTQLPDDILGEAEYDNAGFATALSCDGSILAVSSLLNNNRTGHVRVFKWANLIQSWEQLGEDIDGTSLAEEFGYSLAMSADGITVAIGSRYNDDKADNAGEVRVFNFFENVWIQVGQDIQGEYGGDNFGRSASLSSDGRRLAVGASSNNGTDSGAGHVRVYELTTKSGNTNWLQLGQDLDGEMGGDQFGRSVSLSGDGRRVAVGGHTHDTASGIVDAGHVRVFEYDTANNLWTQIANSLDGKKSKQYLGVTVSLSYDGSRLAVGSPDSEPYMFGVTSIFELSNGAWTQLGPDLFDGGSAIDMSIDGTRVVIGSNSGFGNGFNAGHTAVYEYNTVTLAWTQIGDNINGGMGENSATSVAISADGKRVVSSSPKSGSFNGTEDIGRVRVYDFC
jgi:hypothetical protein